MNTYSSEQEIRKGLRAAEKALDEGRNLVDVRRGLLQALRAIERSEAERRTQVGSLG